MVVVVVVNSGHHFEWMQTPSGPLTKLGGQKHPATHFFKHFGNRSVQVASHDVPQKLKDSPGGHAERNRTSALQDLIILSGVIRIRSRVPVLCYGT